MYIYSFVDHVGFEQTLLYSQMRTVLSIDAENSRARAHKSALMYEVWPLSTLAQSWNSRSQTRIVLSSEAVMSRSPAVAKVSLLHNFTTHLYYTSWICRILLSSEAVMRHSPAVASARTMSLYYRSSLQKYTAQVLDLPAVASARTKSLCPTILLLTCKERRSHNRTLLSTADV